MNVADREILINYFLGRLNESDAVAVETKIATDVEFARTFAALRRKTVAERAQLGEKAFLTPSSPTSKEARSPAPKSVSPSQSASDSFDASFVDSWNKTVQKNDKKPRNRRKNRFAFVPKRVVAPQRSTPSTFLEKKATVARREPSVPTLWRDAWRRLFFPRETTMETRVVPLAAAEFSRTFAFSPNAAFSVDSVVFSDLTSEAAPEFAVFSQDPTSDDDNFVADAAFIAPRSFDASSAPSFQFDVETAFESDATDIWNRIDAPKNWAAGVQSSETLVERPLPFDVFTTVATPVRSEPFDELLASTPKPILTPIRLPNAATSELNSAEEVSDFPAIRPEYPTFLDKTNDVEEFQPLELQETHEPQGTLEPQETLELQEALEPQGIQAAASASDATIAPPIFPATALEAQAPSDIAQELDASEFAPEDSSFLPQEDAVYYAVEREAEVEDSDPTISAEDRRLAELLGRAPSKFDREEYYWEPLDESDSNDDDSKIEISRPANPILAFARRVGRIAAIPEIAVGRAALGLVGYYRVQALGRGDDTETNQSAANVDSKRKQGRLSDMMISIVAGILIAVLIVFPLLRVVVLELYTVIAKSAVRKIGQNVTLSAQTSSSDLLPFISEQLLHPQYESVELSSKTNETAQETSSLFDKLMSPETPDGAPSETSAGTPTFAEPIIDGASFERPSVLEGSIGDSP